MEVHFTPEQEAQLATKAGTDTEQLVKDTVLRLLGGETHIEKPGLELPVWNLGTKGQLHRRDLYDDAR